MFQQAIVRTYLTKFRWWYVRIVPVTKRMSKKCALCGCDIYDKRAEFKANMSGQFKDECPSWGRKKGYGATIGSKEAYRVTDVFCTICVKQVFEKEVVDFFYDQLRKAMI